MKRLHDYTDRFDKYDALIIAIGALLGFLTWVYLPEIMGQSGQWSWLMSRIPDQIREISPAEFNVVGFLASLLVSGFVTGGLYSGDSRGAMIRGYVAGVASLLVPALLGVLFIAIVFLVPLALEGAVGTVVILVISGILGGGLTTIIVLVLSVLAGIAAGFGHFVREGILSL
ncbi:hypothetical protein [Halobaculum marinum]|uniref:Tripartite tricarboxylate transporter TctB family protein n=1 Tax=Halobaculum marinum TaxID=3031996 RepID=A0ABD5WW96_9EURY|nr:hypothetical protein [Halobaculum sp. DT55]